MTAICFALTVARYGWSLNASKWLAFEAILIVLFWTDLEERLLPDELTLGGAAAGILFAVFVHLPLGMAQIFFPGAKPVWQSLFNAVAAAALLAGPLWLVAALYARMRNREGLGLGDVKLLVLFGIFLGLGRGLLALLIGAVAGSVVGLFYIWLARKHASNYELPFGAFLCAAAVLVVLFFREVPLFPWY